MNRTENLETRVGIHVAAQGAFSGSGRRSVKLAQA
jgi:hypothetical protein